MTTKYPSPKRNKSNGQSNGCGMPVALQRYDWIVPVKAQGRNLKKGLCFLIAILILFNYEGMWERAKVEVHDLAGAALAVLFARKEESPLLKQAR